jgi:hypothetical protein
MNADENTKITTKIGEINKDAKIVRHHVKDVEPNEPSDSGRNFDLNLEIDKVKGNFTLGDIIKEKSNHQFKESQERRKSVKKILILSSNPKTTPRLRFDEEVREIEEGLKRSQYRWQFQIQSRLAVRLRDLRRALLDIKPQIVHFIGHGKEDGLLVEDEIGNAVRISRKALAGLFQLFSDQVECVILSACYSAPQAVAISKHIHHVIGMCKEIKEKAAIEFAVGLYDALGAGKSVEEAFKFGCNAILVTFPDIPQRLIPVLKKKKDLEGTFG